MSVESCGRLVARGHWAEDAALKRCTWPIGPRNTYSNVAYLFAAGAVVALRPDQPSVAMAIALVVLGVGSALYHGTKQVWANNLDWFGMYACLLILLLHGYFPHAPGALLGLTWMSGVFAATLAFDQRTHFDLIMGGGMLLAAVPSLLHPSRTLTLAALALFLLAYGCQRLDQRRKLVGVWGHAAWHVLTAGAMALLFLAQG